MQTSDVKWGSYKSWEGPYVIGRNRFSLPTSPSDETKFLATITATEGGCFDAINMYDSCILSSGMIQWCEAHYLVSNLLGYVGDADASLLSPLDPALSASNALFRKRDDGKWRFFFNDARGEVNSATKQQALFLKCPGTIGSWDGASKQHAKTWAAAVASVWESKAAQDLQTEFTSKRLGMFLTKDAQAILFGPQAPSGNSGLVGAVRAAYYSFAANMPAIASEQLRSAVSQSNAAPWSEAWVIEILKKLTFGPKIQIYPGRYDKIRPVIESLFQVNLPDFSKDLAEWRASIDTNSIPGMSPDFLEISEVQEELIAEGYDIGPRGADGVWGPKTKQAVRDFQSDHGLGSDGILGPNTRRAMMDAYLKRVSNVH